MKAHGWYKEFHNKVKESIEYKVGMRELLITEQIISIMDDLNISRADLAKKLNISKAAVSKFLNNGSNITLQRAVAISEALGCDLEFNFKKKATVSETQNIVTLGHREHMKISGCYWDNTEVSCCDDYGVSGVNNVSNAA
ncbi:MAG: helix-turn-helix transcriptional regulator [Bacteroidales bacterium]|jgi:transcriptional regulator with XRE-family HTH domain|nr:helix-turn-helix transcriptional regulator [Bacteroidales bacterium]